MNLERRNELRRCSEKMLQSFAVTAPCDVSPSEIIELLDAAEQAEEKYRNSFFLHANQLSAISLILQAKGPVELAAMRIYKGHAFHTAAFDDAFGVMSRLFRLNKETDKT